jgi:hypothetical protein
MNSAAEMVRKLGIKLDSIVVTLNPNLDTIAKIQDGLGKRVPLLTELPADSQANVVIVWPAQTDDLSGELRRLRRTITPDGAIWAIIPKKRTGKNKAMGVTFEQIQAAALATDLVDNKVVSFSA